MFLSTRYRSLHFWSRGYFIGTSGIGGDFYIHLVIVMVFLNLVGDTAKLFFLIVSCVLAYSSLNHVAMSMASDNVIG